MVLFSPSIYATLEVLWFCSHLAHMPHWKCCGVAVIWHICHTGSVVVLPPGTYATLEWCGFVFTWHICHTGSVVVLLWPGTHATLDVLWFCCHLAHMAHWNGCGFVHTWYICHTGTLVVLLSPLTYTTLVVVVLLSTGTYATLEVLWFCSHLAHMPP